MKGNKIWIPRLKEVYYIVYAYKFIFAHSWENDEDDKLNLYNNNVFKTEEEAQKYIDIDYKFKKLVFDYNNNSNNTIYRINKGVLNLATELIGEEDLNWYIQRG